MLLHRSAGEEGKFLSVKSSEFDQDLFLLSWGPTVAALSYVFDKADEKSIAQRAIDGFRYIYMCMYRFVTCIMDKKNWSPKTKT